MQVFPPPPRGTLGEWKVSIPPGTRTFSGVSHRTRNYGSLAEEQTEREGEGSRRKQFRDDFPFFHLHLADIQDRTLNSKWHRVAFQCFCEIITLSFIILSMKSWKISISIPTRIRSIPDASEANYPTCKKQVKIEILLLETSSSRGTD